MEESIELSQPQAPSKLPTILGAANLVATVALIAALFLGLVPTTTVVTGEDAAGQEQEPEELPPAIYESMDKPIVANFQADGRTRYLQLVVQFMTRREDTVMDIRTHMPAIVDAIYVLLNQKTIDHLQTLEGREELRTEIRELSRTVLEEQTGEAGVEQVYFTTFLFQ